MIRRTSVALAARTFRSIPSLHRLRSTAVAHDTHDDEADAAGWCGVWPDNARNQFSDAVVAKHAGVSAAAALGRSVLDGGVHRLTYAVRGDAVVGVAALPCATGGHIPRREWRTRAWGVGTATGCVHHASSATEDGMLGVEVAPQRMEDDWTERLLQLEIDVDEQKMALREGPDGAWTDVPLSLPRAGVRPWAMLPADGAADSSVRLVSCDAQPVALHAVDGLEDLVGGLGAAAQRRALRWCTEEGFFDASIIAEMDAADAFVGATLGPSTAVSAAATAATATGHQLQRDRLQLMARLRLTQQAAAPAAMPSSGTVQSSSRAAAMFAH
tara:strand:+ start:509 stop:1492 length:984 start_codon:yes stop_codon:yes gene_type:complete